jgi:hypothetical protein
VATSRTAKRSVPRGWKDLISPLFSDKVLRWLMYGVAFATLPVLLNLVLAVTRNSSLSWEQLLGQGELLLVSAGVAASGAGELSGESVPVLRRFQILLQGLAYIIVCLTSVWFADTANLLASQEQVNERAVAVGSLVIFGSSVLNGGCCVAVSRLRK